MSPNDLDGAFHAIMDAVHSGEISESRIDDSARTILEMKASGGLHKNRFVDLDQVVALKVRRDRLPRLRVPKQET